MSTVNTAKIADRRPIAFQSIDDLLADVDQIEKADREGRLKTLGNWHAGQVLCHVSSWIEYGYDGYPMKPPPFFVRWILRLMLKKYLRSGMPSGVRIPGVPAGTTGMDDLPVSQAAERLRKALGRLKNGEPARYDSPAFGPMSHDDRIKLNLRHAELHLSFLNF